MEINHGGLNDVVRNFLLLEKKRKVLEIDSFFFPIPTLRVGK